MQKGFTKMSATATQYEHIIVGEDEAPTIDGTTTKVVELVVEKMAYGWSPEEMRRQHPHLSLGQIHAALAYYWDHAEDMDRQIEDDIQYADALRRRTPEIALVKRLRSRGLLK